MVDLRFTLYGAELVGVGIGSTAGGGGLANITVDVTVVSLESRLFTVVVHMASETSASCWCHHIRRINCWYSDGH